MSSSIVLVPALFALDHESRWRRSFDVEEIHHALAHRAGCVRAVPGLRDALKGKPTLETRKRLEELLVDVRASAASPENLRPLRAVEVLEHLGTSEACAVLKTLADGAPAARLTHEARAAQNRLKARAGP